MKENQLLDKKSLRTFTKRNPDWKELAKDCVCFANAQGGRILIGIEDEALKNWMGRLQEFALIKSKGRTKGTTYYVDATLLKRLNFKGKTTLRKIEPHRLKELIKEDLRIYGESSFGDIHQRIGKEIPTRSIRSQLNNLLIAEVIEKKGGTKGTKYFLTNFSEKN